MNFRPPFQNDNCTTEFIGTFFTTWNRLLWRIMCVVRSCRSGSDILLPSFRTVLYSINLRFSKVEVSSGFSDVMTRWNNWRPNVGKRDLDGPIQRCVLTRLSRKES
jgi:hypothetical protein